MDVTQPVARTAFYCCVIRADDAASATPVCGDTLAARFVNDEVRRDLAPLSRLRNPAASNVARHRIIDDLVRDALAADPNRRVILLGAGFDTRAFRLTGGRWFELDDPALIAYKEQHLPAGTAPNPLVRIPVAFDRENPDDYIGALAVDDAPLVILEGVSVYLSDAALAALASALVRHLPRATLVCDLMSPRFARTFSAGLRRGLQAMGAVFGERTVHPHRAIEAASLRPVARVSIAERAVELKTLRVWRWLLNTVLRELRDGYAVWTFTR
jgi:methyltransferase (TIGR00027 family)